MKLQPISIFSLTMLEAAQFIKNQLMEIEATSSSLLTNEDFNDYFQKLNERRTAFTKALAPVRANDNTARIEAQDQLRDQAFTMLKTALGLSTMSESAEKQEAARSLSLLLKAYKNLDKLNYSAESSAIDELVNELGNSKYEPMVDLLDLSTFVNRLQEHNDQFKTLFLERGHERAQQETFDSKKLKNEMLAVYTEFSEYVVVMARLNSSDSKFKDVLNTLNTNRKYFSDTLARRKGVAAETVSPQ